MNEIGIPQPWLRRGLSAVGVAVVGYEAFRQFAGADIRLWALVLVLVAILAWLVLSFLPTPWRVSGYLCLALMVVGGGLAAAATNGLAITPVVAAIVWVTRSVEVRLAVSAAFGLLAVVLTAVGTLGADSSLLGLLGMEAGVVIAYLLGQNRRQFIRAETQARELYETALAVREEQARTDVLAARQRIAHDIHDVLAHSLGGLVIQLDAVDALLEAGDAAGAATRVREARALAAEGLGEARRAVDALREPPEDPLAAVTAEQFVGSLSALLGSHRSLGGEVEFVERGERHEVSEPLESALRRALQEGLTNARKHAPGEPVTVHLDWSPDAVSLQIENPVAHTAPSPVGGGGHGLTGMRERFAALPRGEATAGVESDRFVVRVEAAAS
jgi:signal transduction histidine kinase